MSDKCELSFCNKPRLTGKRFCEQHCGDDSFTEYTSEGPVSAVSTGRVDAALEAMILSSKPAKPEARYVSSGQIALQEVIVWCEGLDADIQADKLRIAQAELETALDAAKRQGEELELHCAGCETHEYPFHQLRLCNECFRKWMGGAARGDETGLREAREWLASQTPRPEIVAVSATVWGVKHQGSMICAPTIQEAVQVLRDALSQAAPATPPTELCNERWYGTAKRLKFNRWRDGEPCNHPGCLGHVSHPCEGCGRIAGHVADQGEKLL